MSVVPLKYLSRLVVELAVLLGLYLFGCQLAAWLAWPIPGGVIGMALLLLAFAFGWVKPAALQLGAGLLMAEMLLFFIPALMSLLDYGALLRNDGWRGGGIRPELDGLGVSAHRTLRLVTVDSSAGVAAGARRAAAHRLCRIFQQHPLADAGARPGHRGFRRADLAATPFVDAALVGTPARHGCR